MPRQTRILVVDDEQSVREMISVLLKREGYSVTTAPNGRHAVELLEQGERFHLVITDLAMDKGNGMDVLTEIRRRDDLCPVIMITAFGTTESAVEAMKKGAHDYINKPFNIDEFKLIVRQALEHRSLKRENMLLKARVLGEVRFEEIIGRSSAMRRVIDLCRKIADSPATVLISGESGTGKEVVARGIHFGGRRAKMPFVAVNCGALPEPLMESELFGHVRGAFTGAVDDKRGLFEAADGGTIFLDEVGELPLALQVKLLRVLQERTVRPVGSSSEMEIDVRVISATNQDLDELMRVGRFRTDLFYRLNVIQLALPPLRERREDIPELVETFMREFSRQEGKEVGSLANEALRFLMNHDYPGNIRELKNMVERAVTLATGDVIEIKDLPATGRCVYSDGCSAVLPEEGIDLDEALARLEKEYIRQAMERTGNVQNHAAKLLGITVRSLRYRIEKPGRESPGDVM